MRESYWMMQRRVFCFGLASTALVTAPNLVAAPSFRVIAHRGEHRAHPENTLPAVEEAIRLGCDYVEFDVRTTSDGALILMHNGTVDATTDGKGPVSQMTVAEIRKLDAGARWSGKFAGTRVPTYEELLETTKGRIGLYVDVKQASARDIVLGLRRHKMVEASVIYGGAALLGEILALEPGLRVMPEARSVENVRKLTAELHPKVFAFDQADFKDEIVQAARESKAEIYVDRLGAQDSESHWREALQRGASGIQTDKPGELLKLRSSLALKATFGREVASL